MSASGGCQGVSGQGMGTEASHRAGEKLVVAGVEDGEEEVAAEFRDGVCAER